MARFSLSFVTRRIKIVHLLSQYLYKFLELVTPRNLCFSEHSKLGSSSCFAPLFDARPTKYVEHPDLPGIFRTGANGKNGSRRQRGSYEEDTLSEEQMMVAQVAERHREQNIFTWRQRFSGMNANDVKKLRQLSRKTPG
jgi:hypothetical protein